MGGEHYKEYVIQPAEFMLRNKIPFIEGCIIKYVLRFRSKGTPLLDLKKARQYLDMLIEEQENLNPKENDFSSFLPEVKNEKAAETELFLP